LCPRSKTLPTLFKGIPVNKIIAALVAATFSMGAFAQAASAPAPKDGKPAAAAKAEKKAQAKKAKAAKKAASAG
jgi:ribosomal protein L12E/L44/L45/RPP1/RPP2